MPVSPWMVTSVRIWLARLRTWANSAVMVKSSPPKKALPLTLRFCTAASFCAPPRASRWRATISSTVMGLAAAGNAAARRSAGSMSPPEGRASYAPRHPSFQGCRVGAGGAMDGLMMQVPLTLVHFFDRAAKYFAATEIVSRRPDKSIQGSTYGDFHRRAQKLANALTRLGVTPGERVATLAWNHGRHLEAYFAIPLCGAVLHTLNPRLSVQDIAYIINHADDSVVIVDDVLWGLWERIRPEVKPRHVIVWGHGQPAPEGAIDYEQLIESESPDFSPPRIDESDAAGLCYTSGTTGHPKGVLYSHRALVVHSLMSALQDSIGLAKSDVVLPVVPMFHVNAWGLPFTATMVGAKQVFPGPHLDPLSVLSLLADEQVTLTAGVPTVWLAILDQLDSNPGKWNLKALHTMIVGGSAAPQAMSEGFEKRHGFRVIHGWGIRQVE